MLNVFTVVSVLNNRWLPGSVQWRCCLSVRQLPSKGTISIAPLYTICEMHLMV